MQPTVSVIILQYNGIDDTCRCLQSLMCDGYGEKEVIVWDNGSAGDSVAVLEREFGDRIRILRSVTNIGVAAGYNAAAREAHGEFIVFLNNDTAVTAGWVEPLVAAMRADPSVAVCQPKILSFYDHSFFDFSGGCGGFIDRHGFPYTRGRVFGVIEKDEGQYDDSREIMWASAACMIVRRDVWSSLGGADERFFAYMDEIDFCWRVRRAGLKVICVPGAVIYHKGGGTWKGKNFRRRFHEHRNNLLMIFKNVPASHLITLLPVRIAFEAAAFFYYLYKRQWQFALAVPAAFFEFVLMIRHYLGRSAPDIHPAPLGRRSAVWGYFFMGRDTYRKLHSTVF